MKAFSRKQLQILAFPKTDYDAIICDGSIRAGKTSVMSVAFIIWAMQSFNHQSFGICSKTIGTAERNIILPLLAMSFMRKRYRMSYKTREKLIVFDGKHENTFFLFGGKDAASYQLIHKVSHWLVYFSMRWLSCLGHLWIKRLPDALLLAEGCGLTVIPKGNYIGLTKNGFWRQRIGMLSIFTSRWMIILH